MKKTQTMKTDIQEIKKTALELFKTKEINEAFDYLSKNLDHDNNWQNQLILLEAKNNDLKRQRIAKTISKKKYRILKNRIYLSFSEIVNSLEEPYQEDDSYSPEPYYYSSNYSSTYTPNESLLVAIIILLILLVIGVIFIIFKLN